MRIIYSHYLSNENHPATRMVHSVAEELRGFGHEVFVHRSEGPEIRSVSSQIGPAQPRRFDRTRKRFWFAKAIAKNREYRERDRRAVEQFRPDIVLCRNDAYCYSIPEVCLQYHIPLVTYSDAPAAFEARRFNSAGRWHPPLAVERIEKWVLGMSRGVVTVSHPAKAILERYRTGTPIAVAHNGVDSEQFRPLDDSAKRAVRTRAGAERPLIAGFVGSFRAFHGADLLREVIRRSAPRTDLEWWLIGDGPRRKQLESELGGLPGVRFFGNRPAEEIPALLACFDVSIIPHEMMGDEFYFCPLKILESLACGVPCVASHQGDIPELLDVEPKGETLAGQSPADWLASMNRLLDSEPRRRALSAALRAKAENCFSWSNTARKVESVLRDARANADRSAKPHRSFEASTALIPGSVRV